jgi:hypothetical protein
MVRAALRTTSGSGSESCCILKRRPARDRRRGARHLIVGVSTPINGLSL